MTLLQQTVLVALCITLMATGQADMCPTCGVELDNKVSQIESQEAVVEERQYIMAEKFGRALDTLQIDSDTLKTTVQRLQTDINSLGDQLGNLDGMKQDVIRLGGTVADLQHRMMLNLNSVRGTMVKVTGDLEKEQKQQGSSLEHLGNTVKENQGSLAETRGKLAEQGQVLVALQHKVEEVQNNTGSTVSGDPEQLKALQGSLGELRETYETLQQRQDTQFNALRNSLEEIRKDITLKEYYGGGA